MFKHLAKWFWSPEGIWPWVENNQGLASVLALVLALFALVWEFRQAAEARQEALNAKIEMEARDRKALLAAKRKALEDKVTAERDEIASFCFALEQLFAYLDNAARLEIEYLGTKDPAMFGKQSDFLGEGQRVRRAATAILARPPADRDSVLAACRGLDPFEYWAMLPDLTSGPRAEALARHRIAWQEACGQLADARHYAGKVALEHLERIAEEISGADSA